MSSMLKKFNKKPINREHFPLDLEKGLTSEQVQQRINDGLINKTKKQVSKSYGRIFYENLVNPFNILLFIVFVMMLIAKLDLLNFVFMGILTLNIVIGLYQDIRARQLIDKLKVVSSVKVRALRDGKIKEIGAQDLVLSDLVEIKQGSQLVCDGQIVQGFVEMNESLLTGESNHVSKTVNDEVFSGSFVAAGTALYRIEHIGRENYAENLSQNAKKFKRVKSDILVSIRMIFKVIGFFVVILGSVQIGLAFLNHLTFKDAVSSISASLVGMTPIGMYLLTSVTLAVGAVRLAKKNMLTQDMYCIETLARIDTLCLDKTGTLTDGKLKVYKVVSTSSNSEKDIAKIIKTLVEATKDENITASAIKEEFKELNSFDAYSAIPFSSERKYSAVMLEDGRSIVMGAREFVPHSNKEIDDMCKEYEKDGMRVLVLTQYTKVIRTDEPLKEAEIIGFIVLEDNIREDAPDNIKWFRENGVDIRIITGDNPESAAEIARRAGIENADKYISLEGMSPEEDKLAVRTNTIFGRVTPEQKQLIVECLQNDGHSVAMTGDGVNDILALRIADCSIAMASGSDAAKTVAHLVSLDSSFSSLPDVVKEGRRVINNLQRSVSLFLIKTVFAIVLTTLFICHISKLTAMYPFRLVNMLIWETLTIGIGSLFLSLQPNDEQIKSKFLINISFRIMPAAIVQIGLVLFFFWYCKDLESAISLSTLAFSIFSFVIFVRVCLPFDVYRAILVIGLAFVGFASMLADYFANSPKVNLGIHYSTFSPNTFLTVGIVILVAIILYALLNVAASYIHKYVDKKRKEKIHDNIERS